MSPSPPLSVTFHLSPEDRERFRALHEARTGLDPDHELAGELERAGLVEEDGPALRLTQAGAAEFLRLMHVAREVYDQAVQRANARKCPGSPGVERLSARTGDRGERDPHEGAGEASPADSKSASAAPRPPTRRIPK